MAELRKLAAAVAEERKKPGRQSPARLVSRLEARTGLRVLGPPGPRAGARCPARPPLPPTLDRHPDLKSSSAFLLEWTLRHKTEFNLLVGVAAQF